MFEKIKEKVQKSKEWAVKHKTDLAYVGGCIVGSVVTAIVISNDDKKKRENFAKSYSHELKVLSMKPNADWIDIYGSNTGSTSLSDLSDKLIENGGIADSKVVGALVYTRE